jgi:hypothetical protein
LSTHQFCNQTLPLLQVNHLDGVAILTQLASLLTKYPPHLDDNPILARMPRLGPGRSRNHSAAPGVLTAPSCLGRVVFPAGWVTAPMMDNPIY